MKRSSAKKRGDAPGSGTKVSTDDEILADRKRLDGFALADMFTKFLSWGLWALAGYWFLCFIGAPNLESFHPGVGESTALLFICGHLAGGLSSCSPRGLWSLWRCAWHFAWCFALLYVGAAFSNAAITGTSKPASSSSIVSAGRYVAAACVGLGLFAIFTYPRGQPLPTIPSRSVTARMVLFADGALGGLICFSIFSNSAPHLSDQLGRSAVAASIISLGMWSSAVALCRTDAEVLVAMPSAILFHLVAAVMAFVLKEAALPAGLSLAAAVVHMAFYLPLPLSDPDSNIFHTSVRKGWRNFTKMLSTPVAGGFGDDGD